MYSIIFIVFLFQYFQKELPGKVESDIEGLFNLAYSIKINTKKMKKMEKDYAELRKKEQEEMVELRVRKRLIKLCNMVTFDYVFTVAFA